TPPSNRAAAHWVDNTRIHADLCLGRSAHKSPRARLQSPRFDTRDRQHHTPCQCSSTSLQPCMRPHLSSKPAHAPFSHPSLLSLNAPMYFALPSKKPSLGGD